MAKEKATEKNVLKRRNADGTSKRVAKRVPNKMNLVKPKRLSTESTGVGNSGALVMPTDKVGLTVELRAAMLKIASRIGSDEDNLALLDGTYEVLRAHVGARAEQNVENGTRVLRKRSDRILEASMDAGEAVELVDKVVTTKNKKTGKKKRTTRKVTK